MPYSHEGGMARTMREHIDAVADSASALECAQEIAVPATSREPTNATIDMTPAIASLTNPYDASRNAPRAASGQWVNPLRHQGIGVCCRASCASTRASREAG